MCRLGLGKTIKK